MTAVEAPATPAREPDPEVFDERRAWRALAVVMGATVMVALDLTIVNVALHDIGVDLGAGALAVAILGAVVALRSGDSVDPERIQSGYDAAFAVAAVGVGLAFVLATRLPKRVTGATGVEGAVAVLE